MNKKHNDNLGNFDAAEFLANNKVFFIWAAIAIFIVFGAYQFYSYNKMSNAAADFDAFTIAKSNKDYAKQEEIAYKTSDGASIVATFDLAQYYISQKGADAAEKAKSLLTHAIKNFKQPYSNQASVYLATLLANDEKYVEALELLNKIKPNDAFFFDASNIKAFIFAQLGNEEELAATKNDILTNSQASTSQKEIANWIE